MTRAETGKLCRCAVVWVCICAKYSTWSMKCLCEGRCRSRSCLSRWSLKVNRNSVCRLMSVARMREPSCCSMSCLRRQKDSSSSSNHFHVYQNPGVAGHHKTKENRDTRLRRALLCLCVCSYGMSAGRCDSSPDSRSIPTVDFQWWLSSTDVFCKPWRTHCYVMIARLWRVSVSMCVTLFDRSIIVLQLESQQLLDYSDNQMIRPLLFRV